MSELKTIPELIEEDRQARIAAYNALPFIKDLIEEDFNAPNTRPGFCPECAQPANIWNATRNVWECCYCNWSGSKPNKEKHIITEVRS